jgi:hypothetical protein
MRRIGWLLALWVACHGGTDSGTDPGTDSGTDSGTATTGAPCASGAVCTGDAVCLGPDTSDVGCGVPPMEFCAGDADCGGLRCHAVVDSCSPDGFGSDCAAACDPASNPCAPGLVCAAGACVVETCVDQPAVCAPWQVCDPAAAGVLAPVWEQSTGCVFVACTDDAVCGGGACVNGLCQSGLGVCGEPPLTPP